MNNIKCPYCDESDLDLVGLKIHLLNYCEDFNELEIVWYQGKFEKVEGETE